MSKSEAEVELVKKGRYLKGVIKAYFIIRSRIIFGSRLPVILSFIGVRNCIYFSYTVIMRLLLSMKCAKY